MDEILKEYKQLQNLIVERCEGKIPAISAELLVSRMERFSGLLETSLIDIRKKFDDRGAENDLLRSLLGVPLEPTKAKLIEANAEIQFLRGQLAALNGEFKRLQQQEQHLEVRQELNKRDSELGVLDRQALRAKFEAEAEIIRQRFLQLQEQYTKLLGQKEAEKAAIANTIPGIDQEARHKVKEELRQVGLKLRAICSSVIGSSQYCIERWDKVKEKRLSTRFSKLIGLDKLMRIATGSFDDLIADLALIKKNSGEMIRTIDTYVSLLDDLRPEFANVDIRKLIDEARKHGTDTVRARKLVVTWPSEKKYPVFVSDPKILGEIIDIVITNALEALPEEGKLDIMGLFTDTSLELRFSDNGPGITLSDRDKLFKPFFTTKPGHAGLGLYRAGRLAFVLGGSLRCERPGSGSEFVLHIPSHTTQGKP
jgi:signal transduction histidine kinase